LHKHLHNQKIVCRFVLTFRACRRAGIWKTSDRNKSW